MSKDPTVHHVQTAKRAEAKMETYRLTCSCGWAWTIVGTRQHADMRAHMHETFGDQDFKP